MTSPGGNVVEIVVKVTDKTKPELQAVEKQVEKVGGAFRRMGEIAGGVLLAQGVQAGARRAMALLQSTVQAASALGESVNAVGKVFEDQTPKIIEFGKTAAEQVGLSQRAFNQAVVPLGSMLKNTGMSMSEVADETINLTKRASDMASVFDTSVEDALFAISAAFRGETEPIRRYGVTINELSIQQKALATSGKANAAELTAQEKAAARLSLIFEQTASTAGDFKDTSDSLANAQRIATATIENAKAEIGAAYLPIMAKAAEVTAGLAQAFSALGPKVQLVVAVVVAIGAAAVIAVPRIVAFNAALATMAANGGFAAKALGGLVKVLGRVGLAVAALGIVREIGKEFGVLNDVLGAVPGIGDELVQMFGDTTSSLTFIPGPLSRVKEKQEALTTAMEDQVKAGEDLVKIWDKIHGTQVSATKELLQAKDAIDAVGESFEENGAKVDGNSRAALRNQVAMANAAQEAVEAAQAHMENGGSAEEAAKIMDDLRREMVKATGATGKERAEVERLSRELFKLPPTTTVTIRVNEEIRTRVLSDAAIRKQVGFAHGGISGAAAGGPRGGMTWVGEQGPELVRLPLGSTVYPSGQSMAMASQAAQGSNRHSAAPVVVNGAGFGQIAFDWLANEVRRRGGQLAVLGLKNP